MKTLITNHEEVIREKVRVYELYSIEKLVQLKFPIQRTIFEPYGIKIDNEKTFFSISETSGWMNFIDHAQLWQSENNNLIDLNPSNVVKSVEEFIENVNQKITDFNLRHHSDLSSFFPQKHERKLNNCFAVMQRDGDWIDHWLCVFETYVSDFRNGESKALVFGSALELRIGIRNRVIAFSCHWRPYRKLLDTELLAPATRNNHIAKDPEHGHVDKHQNTSSNTNIMYVLDGDGNEQYHLVPYYYEVNGHHLLFTPASKFSLSVTILQQNSKDQAQLIAVVEGGSGDYSYEWSYWNFAGAKESERIIELGNGQTRKIKIDNREIMINTIKLPIGFYHLRLSVVDSKTRAFKQIQQLIFSKAI